MGTEMNIETGSSPELNALYEEKGLNAYLVRQLQSYNIHVNVVGDKDNPWLDIDTSDVYLARKDRSGNLIQGTMSALPLEERTITSVERTSDGIVTFTLEDEEGRQEQYIFSTKPIADQPPAVRDQLQQMLNEKN